MIYIWVSVCKKVVHNIFLLKEECEIENDWKEISNEVMRENLIEQERCFVINWTFGMNQIATKLS